MLDKPMLAVLDNNDRLQCLTDDYFDSSLHTFLQGTAAFFTCSVLQTAEIAQYFKVGNKLSFVSNDVNYHFDITKMNKNEQLVTIQADSLTLELRNEFASEYKASKAMTFKQYLDVFLFAGDNPLVMGINEVSDKSLQAEWTGDGESILARLFSLANKFDAEIEFETVLNKHWGLDKVRLNVYRAHSDKCQGIGKKRTDIIMEYGNNVETVEYEENIDDLKTAILPIGTDGLLIGNVVIDEKDKNGNQLFLSIKTDNYIRAVQSRDRFRSKMGSFDGYIAKRWTYETTNENVLAGQALAELKKLCEPKVTVTIKGYEYLGIGDTVLVQNTAYVPTLNLSARISEQEIYFDDPSKNASTFTNVEILQSQVDQSLLDRVNALIEQTKPYTLSLVSDNGVTFKNSEGETTLSAIVYNGTQVITPDVTVRWYKDDVWVKTAYNVTVNAPDIIDKAVYRAEVMDTNGVIRAKAEVTVFNVDDGRGIKGKPVLSYASSGSINTVPTTWKATIPAVPAGSYLWTREVTTYSDNTTSEIITPVLQGPKGDPGNDGIAGKDGIGIKSTQIMYAQSTSGTTAPKTGWTSQVPTLIKGQYLWTQTTWLYTDNTGESGYTVSYNAKDGNTGANGVAGKDGVGILNTIIEYVGASSGTSKPMSGWSTTIPVVPAGEYLWTRTTWQYTDGTSEQGFTNALMGRTGASGKDGVAGKDGIGIKATAITYQASTNGTTAPTGTWSANVPTVAKGSYLWTKTVWTYTDNSTETGYSVAYMGTNGNNGANGVAGKDGVGIASTTITYAASTSGTTAPTSGYTASVPSVAEGSFLWTKTVWAYTDGTNETGYSVAKQGAKGADGKDGKSITDSRQEWAESMSGTTAPTTWQTAIPTVSAGQYLWSRVTETWSDGDKTYRFTIGKIGENGQNAQMMFLSATANQMMFNADNTPKTTQSSVVTAKYQNVTGTVAFTAKGIKTDGTSETLALTGTGDSRTITSAMFKTDWVMITVTATLAGLTDTLSIIKVNDGAQGIGGPKGYFHSAWAMSADGRTGFSTTVSEGKWYIGTYFDFVEADSTDPTRYNWLELAGAVNMYIAYAWSADGTDRFTKDYPNENLLTYSNLLLRHREWTFSPDTGVYSINQTNSGTTSTWFESQIPIISQTDTITISYESVTIGSASKDAGYFIAVGGWGPNWGRVKDWNIALSEFKLVNGRYSRTISISESRAQTFYGIQFKTSVSAGGTANISFKNLKVEDGSGTTLFTPNPQDDYDNAVPRYIGRSLKDSNYPSDYKWEPNPERKPWTAYAQGLNGEGFSLMPYGENLLVNSRNSPRIAGYQNTSTGTVTNTNDGTGIRVTYESGEHYFRFNAPTNSDMGGFEAGKTYILSSKIRGKRDISSRFEIQVVNGVWISFDTGLQNYSINETLDTYVVSVVTIPSNAIAVYASYQHFNPVEGDWFELRDTKLEPANTMGIPTPWTPAPSEDQLGAIPKYVGTAALPYEDWTKYAYTMNPEWADLNATLGLNTKVDNGRYQEDKSQIFEDIANRVTKEEAAETNRIAQKALDMITAYTDPDSGKAAADLNALEQRIVGAVNELGAKIARWNFIDTWMTAGEEGFSIANAKSTTKFLVKNNRMSFINNGEEVAYFSGQSFMIQRGIVTQGMQIGSHKEEALNKDHTVTRWIAT